MVEGYVPEDVIKLSDVEKQRDRVRDLIVMFFDCRRAHHVNQCSNCEYWITIFEHHWDDCSCKDEQVDFDKLCHELKSRLRLEYLRLPRYIQLFGDK